jgi:hypothetical protein
MEKVILKPGDKVQHKSLGTGVVTNADDQFCTVRFESRDAMFRLPDAFEEGFLSSKDAVIISDEDEIEEEELEELEEESIDLGSSVHADSVKAQSSADNDVVTTPQVTSKQKTRGLINVAVFWLILFVPIIALLLWIPDETLNITGWIMIPMYFVFVFVSNRIGRKAAEKGTRPGSQIQSNKQSGLDPLTELELGLMGSEILHHAIEREKQASEKRRYDSLYWQESIRDKNPRHDFDYDHMDD